MKKFFLILILFFLSIPIAFCAQAQTAEIIDFKGDVMIKVASAASWQQAGRHVLLMQDGEIKTGPNSFCTVTFDDELKNILTVKENSQVYLQSVRPAALVLPSGRVFALIDELAVVGDFTIRTPVAVAGVRGTGESVESTGEGTTVTSFEDTVYVQGTDSSGNTTGTTRVPEGKGVHIDTNGGIGDLFPLDDDALRQWSEYRDMVDRRRSEHDSGEGLNELLAERQDDIEDETFFEQRREEEMRQESEQEELEGESELQEQELRALEYRVPEYQERGE